MSKKVKDKSTAADGWKTGAVPATEMQKEELTDLNKSVDDNLSKAGASHQIDELQKKKLASNKKK